MSGIGEIQLLFNAYFRIPFEQFTEYLMQDVSSNEKQRETKSTIRIFMVTRGEGPDPVRLCGLRHRATGKVRRRGKLTVKEYGTPMYARNRFSLTCPAIAGKDSCGMDISLILNFSAV